MLRAFFYFKRGGLDACDCADAGKRAPACWSAIRVTTVSIVCTIKAPVPVRAEDGLDPHYLHGR
jgi:hypothetical protein